MYLRVPGEWDFNEKDYKSKEVKFNELKYLSNKFIVDAYPLNKVFGDKFSSNLYCRYIGDNLYYFDKYGKMILI